MPSVFSPQALLTAAVLVSGPSKERPSAGPPDGSTWSPWLRSGSHWDSSDACPHNRCPGGRGSRPSPLGCLGSRSGYRGRSAPPHIPRSPRPQEGRWPGGGQGVQGPPPSHRIGPSHCRYSQPGSSAGGPHSTRRVATDSRPRPPSDSGSRSAPPGSWCAGHSPCLWGGTGRPCGQAPCPVRSPPGSPSYSALQPHTHSPSGSSAGGPSSRQPLGQDSSPTPQT